MTLKEFTDFLTINGFSEEKATATAQEYIEAELLKNGLEIARDEIAVARHF